MMMNVILRYASSVLKDHAGCRHSRGLPPCVEPNKGSLFTPSYSSTVVRMQVWFRACRPVPFFYFCGSNPGEEHFLYTTPLLSPLKIAEMDVCLMVNIFILWASILRIPFFEHCMWMPLLNNYCHGLYRFIYATATCGGRLLHKCGCLGDKCWPVVKDKQRSCQLLIWIAGPLARVERIRNLKHWATGISSSARSLTRWIDR